MWCEQKPNKKNTEWNDESLEHKCRHQIETQESHLSLEHYCRLHTGTHRCRPCPCPRFSSTEIVVLVVGVLMPVGAHEKPLRFMFYGFSHIHTWARRHSRSENEYEREGSSETYFSWKLNLRKMYEKKKRYRKTSINVDFSRRRNFYERIMKCNKRIVGFEFEWCD